MAFRNKDGDYLGDQSNYEYTGNQSIKRIRAKKKYVLFWIILLIALFFIAGLFLLYLALFGKVQYYSDKNNYLLSAVCFFALAFYTIYRFIKYMREEKEYEKELEKLDNKKD